MVKKRISSERKKHPNLPAWTCALIAALRADLRKVGIEAEVRCEKVTGVRAYRINVVAKDFKKLRFSERQSLAWRIAENAVGYDKLLRVVAIYTLTPEEVGGE